MDVFAISDLAGLTESQIELVKQHWRRRVVAQSVVLVPGGITAADVAWMAELPGRIVIAPREHEDATAIADVGDSYENVFVITNNTLRFDGLTHTTGQQEKGLVVAACHGNHDWPRAELGGEQSREDDKDAFVVLAAGCPFYINQATDEAQQWIKAGVNACVYGGASIEEWTQCYQGKFGKSAWDSTDYRLVDAYFLDGIITYIGDVDCAGWLHKGRERQATTVLSWNRADNAVTRPTAPLSLERAPVSPDVLYRLPDTPRPAPAKTAATSTVTASRPPGLTDPNAADGYNEYERWLTYLRRPDNLALTVQAFRAKWPGVATWYAEYFALYPDDTTISAIRTAEAASPSWPPAADGDGWRVYLSKMPGRMLASQVRNIHQSEWDRWRGFWESYPSSTSVSNILATEQASPTRTTVARTIAGGMVSVADANRLQRLCDAYSDQTVLTVMRVRAGDPEVVTLDLAARAYGCTSMRALGAAIDIDIAAGMEHTDETSRADETLAGDGHAGGPVHERTAASFVDAVAGGVVGRLLDGPWHNDAALFRPSAAGLDVRAGLEGDLDRLLWSVRPEVELGELGRRWPQLQLGSGTAGDALVERLRDHPSFPAANTPPRASDWPRIIERIRAVDATSTERFHAELVVAVFSP